MNTIHRNEIMTELEKHANKFFSMVYIKADGSVREATGRLYVSNPKHTLVPGTGAFLGLSGKDAYKMYNNIKYFDCDVNGNPCYGKTPGKGDYRTAKIERIKSIKINKVLYEVID